MLIETVVVGKFQCNCTIIACEKTKEAIIIDPGDEAEKIIERVKHYGLQVKYLFHTHAHLDHFMATRSVKESSTGEIVLHKGDHDLYNSLQMQAEMFGFKVKSPLKVDKFVEDQEYLLAGKEISGKVIHTPGHSPGSVCFYLGDQKKPIIFSGDTLFADSIGRTDLWGGSYPILISSIKEKIFKLEESTIVYPGHGPKTTVWQEKKHNPFFR